MLWNIVKGVVAAVLVTKITERYFKDKNAVAAPAQSNARSKPDVPGEAVPSAPLNAKPRTARKPAAAKSSVKSAVKPKPKPVLKPPVLKPVVKQDIKDTKPLNDPLNATESTI